MLDTKFDIFVCYDESTGADFASALHSVLTSRGGYKVFVAHIYRKLMEKDFREANIDPIIDNCKIFVFVNSYRSIESQEIHREIKRAFPNGDTTGHGFWAFRENDDLVKFYSDEINNQTKINFGTINQIPFSNSDELKRIALKLCDSNKGDEMKEVKTTKIPSIPLIKTRISFKISEFLNTNQILSEIKELMKKGQREQALEQYDLLLSADPKNLGLLNDKGICLSELGRFSEANDYFSLAITLNSKMSYLWRNKAITLTYQKLFDNALYCIQKEMALSPNNSELKDIKAWIYFEKGDFDKALNMYDEELRKKPNNSRVMSAKASVLEKRGDKETAKNLLMRAIEIDPKNENAWYNLAVLHTQENKIKDAIECYEKSLSIESKDPRTLNNLGVLYKRTGQIEKAITLYDIAITERSFDAKAYHNKGLALASLGKYDESIKQFDIALRKDQKYVNAYINKGISLYYLKKTDDALLSLNKGLEIKHDWIGYNTIGTIYLEQNNWNKAIEMFSLALIYSDYDSKPYSNLSLAYYNDQNYENALNVVEEGLNKHKDYLPLLIQKSAILTKLKKLEDAISICKYILKQDETIPTAYYNMSCASSLMNKKADALQYLEKAIVLDPVFKKMAKEDSDLNLIKDTSEFAQLTKETAKSSAEKKSK